MEPSQIPMKQGIWGWLFVSSLVWIGLLPTQSVRAIQPSDEYALVPPGSFFQGSCLDEPGREWGGIGEPLRLVHLSRFILVARTEVTQEEWAEVMEPTPYHLGCGDDCPVGGVSFWEALDYANRLSAANGLQPCYRCRIWDGTTVDCTDMPVWGEVNIDPGFVGYDCEGYRLPTDSEWEYFARAGTATAFPWGDFQEGYPLLQPDPGTALDAGVWYLGNSDGVVHPVAQKLANGLGLFDTHGNVAEWVWGDGTAPEDGETDPITLWHQSDYFPTARGGAYVFEAELCRSATRGWVDLESSQLPWIGLRLVRTAPNQNELNQLRRKLSRGRPPHCEMVERSRHVHAGRR